MTLNTRLWSSLSLTVCVCMNGEEDGEAAISISFIVRWGQRRTQTHISELIRPPVVQALLQPDCCILNSCCNAKAALKPHPETLLVLTTSFKSDRITYFSATLGSLWHSKSLSAKWLLERVWAKPSQRACGHAAHGHPLPQQPRELRQWLTGKGKDNVLLITLVRLDHPVGK